ncbi:MAG: mannosyltransferase family protein [Vicinamibacterales bacterium]
MWPLPVADSFDRPNDSPTDAAARVHGTDAVAAPADKRDLPQWARLVDVAGVAFVLLALSVLIGGRTRMTLGPVRLSIGSVERQLLVAALLLAVRHWRYPAPSLLSRARAGWFQFWSEPGIRTLATYYWTVRLSVLVVGYLAAVSFGLPERGPFRVSENEFMNLPARWDSGWYLAIATDGYRYSDSDGQQSIAFMPAFPVVMRLAGSFFAVDQNRLRTTDGPDRGRILWAGVVVSLVLGWLASVWLFRLARSWLDESQALAAVVLLQTYPFALFYGAAYSESLFLASTVGALWLFRRRAWLGAATWGLVAGISRPNGFITSVLIGLLLLEHLWRGRHSLRDWATSYDRFWGPMLAATAPVISLGVFCWMIYDLTGDPFRWMQLHAAWGREYRSLGSLASLYYNRVAAEGVYGYTSTAPIDAMNVIASCVALAAIYPVWRRLGLPYAAWMAATLLPPLSMGGFLSMGRVTSTAFPMFLWLGSLGGETTRRGLMVGFAILQGLAAALFFSWRPLY